MASSSSRLFAVLIANVGATASSPAAQLGGWLASPASRAIRTHGSRAKDSFPRTCCRHRNRLRPSGGRGGRPDPVAPLGFAADPCPPLLRRNRERDFPDAT